MRFACDCTLTARDVAEARHPADEIAIADHALDRHGADGFCGELRAPYGVAYRSLLPKGLDNALVAGRIAGFDEHAASSCRLSRTMTQLGEAAGVAAALCVRKGVPPRALDAAEIRRTMETDLDLRP